MKALLTTAMALGVVITLGANQPVNAIVTGPIGSGSQQGQIILAHGHGGGGHWHGGGGYHHYHGDGGYYGGPGYGYGPYYNDYDYDNDVGPGVCVGPVCLGL